MKHTALTSNFFAYGIGLIVFLIFIGRAVTKYIPRGLQIYHAREVQVYNKRSVQIHNPREIRIHHPREIRIYDPREIRRASRLVLKVKALTAISGLLFIWIVRGFMFAPIARLVAKGLLL